NGTLHLFNIVVAVLRLVAFPHLLQRQNAGGAEMGIPDEGALAALGRTGIEKQKISRLKIRELRLRRKAPEVHFTVAAEAVVFHHLFICYVRY
ncbi:hypothetical protein, partial [Galactobacillus timonensis]|uniref:hypothetical protein n=1 Tax=Galactobacillus timonensis TaxID=2041840 RepID=UPI002409EE89